MSTPCGRVCSVCGESKYENLFSKKQWLAKAHSRKCKACIDVAEPTAPTAAAMAQGADYCRAKAKESRGKGKTDASSTSKKESAGKAKGPSAVVKQMDEAARMRLDSMMSGVSAEEEEDDPFVCDISGALISMIKDGRYHFNDGRGPDDPSAVCMSVKAFETFDSLATEHSDTWEPEYADKNKWQFIPPGSPY